MNWFGSKGRETSPGGSVIQRHSPKNFMKPRFGFSDSSTGAFTEAREAVYQQLFGEAGNVSHELIPQVPISTSTRIAGAAGTGPRIAC